ncbi:MAG: TrkA family potassium uptake protein [Chloroflexota bacterium]|jgi:trk system potassium uptake protein TrkA|nr:TrkA family potassium uptake protein [Chloroflexota bacterium]
MYVVILGAGRVGSSLASWFLDSGSEVAVIDSDKKKTQILDEALGKICVLGDGANISVMEEAGLTRTDMFIATTGEDHINLIACQIARGKFEVHTTVSVLNEANNGKLFDMAGIDFIVDMSRLVISEIETALAPKLVEEV